MMPAGNNRQTFTRADRVRKALMREIADIIATEIKDPRLDNQVISITDVEVSTDLSVAKVYISILADEAQQTELMTLLLGYKGKIRKAVGQRIQLRHTPELSLHLDTSLERGTHLSLLLEKIARGELD
jgi:ribosome-binding factor A